LVSLDTNTLEESVDEFFEYFRREFLSFIPANVAASKAESIKLARELYRSKGSVAGVKLLFRILYNEEVDVSFPSEFIFKSSAAKWNRDTTIRFTLDSGVVPLGEDIPIVIVSGDNSYSIEAEGIFELKNFPNVYEAILKINFKLSIPDGGTISNGTFTGTLSPTIITSTILTNGLLFAVGDLYEVPNGSGSGLTFKVKAVNADSSLRHIEIIKFGHNYVASFNGQILPIALQQTSVSSSVSVTLLDTNLDVIENNFIPSDDNINSTEETTLLATHDYTEAPHNYLINNTYVGVTQAEVESNTFVISSENAGSIASIFFKLGYVLEYPGYYSTNVGFPSDASFIQDGNYYQQFSYVIGSTKDYKDFEAVVKKTIHPSGLKLFGNFLINKSIDINININVVLSIFDLILQDTVSTTDAINNLVVIKGIADSANAEEASILSLIKEIEDDANVVDVPVLELQKPFTDSTSPADTNTVEATKNRSDTSTVNDVPTLTPTVKPSDFPLLVNFGCIVLGEQYYDFSGEGEYVTCGYYDNETPFANRDRKLEEFEVLNVTETGGMVINDLYVEFSGENGLYGTTGYIAGDLPLFN
jgi:hypothetical protein